MSYQLPTRRPKPRDDSYTDADYKKKEAEYERRANSPQAREMNQIMRRKK